MPAKVRYAASMFRGFARQAPAFFFELAAEMSKPWFEANKQRYQDEWVAPMTELLEQVSAGLAKTYAPRKLAVKVMRIYRDVRFAKDKAPYKTHIAGLVSITGARPIDGGVSALYAHFGVDEEYLGAGTYFFDPAQLAKWRKLVLAERTGAPLAQRIAKLRKAGYRVGGFDDYKRMPRGLPDDHPRAELLRMRGLSVGFPPPPKGILHEPRFARWLVTHAKASVPITTWLLDQLR